MLTACCADPNGLRQPDSNAVIVTIIDRDDALRQVGAWVMPMFYRVENFPFTVERENGDITPATIKDKQVIQTTYLKLENIFNNNAQVKQWKNKIHRD